MGWLGIDWQDPETRDRIRGGLLGFAKNISDPDSNIGTAFVQGGLGAEQGRDQFKTDKLNNLTLADKEFGLRQKLGQTNYFRQMLHQKPVTFEDMMKGNFGDAASAPSQFQAPVPSPDAIAPMGVPTPMQPKNDALIPGIVPSATAMVESRNNPNAVSPVGASGTMQTMPGTLRDPGFGVRPAQDNSPEEKTRTGVDYLYAMNKRYGNPVLAHIAQNWGPGNTDLWLKSGGDFSRLPKETQMYLGRIATQQAMQARGQAPQEATTAPEQLAQPQPTQQDDAAMQRIAEIGINDPELAQKLMTQQHTLMSPEQKRSEGYMPDDVVTIDGTGNRTLERRSDLKSQAAVDQQLDISKQEAKAKQDAIVEAIGGPESLAVLAGPIAHYQSPMNTTGRSAVLNSLIMQEVLKQNPDYRAQNFNTANKTQQAFATGKQGDTVRSLNVSISHLQTLRELGEALQNGNINLVNAARQKFAEQFGVPAPTNFDTAKSIVADEVAKGVIGGQSAQSDRETLAASLRRERSPQAINGAINTFQELLAGQMRGLKEQFVGNIFMPKTIAEKMFADKLLPETQAILDRTRSQHEASGPPPSNKSQAAMLPRPKTPADAAKLKPGTRYLQPDGTEMVR